MSLSKLGRLVSRSLTRRQPLWTLKDFSAPHFEKISASRLIEEEALPGYLPARYYPVRIGELFASRYQVVGKLGFGTASTVWLARDLTDCRHVALKVFIRSDSWGGGPSRELQAYQRLGKGPAQHPGRDAIRTMLDSFAVSGPDGEHQCLVHPPLWDSVRTFVKRNPIGRLPAPILAAVLQEVFLALDYAQQCQVIHTDIKADNIMFGIKDPAIFAKFEQAELDHPTPRKEINGRIVYLSRELEAPSGRNINPPVLCDFGLAAWGEESNMAVAQPDVYRAPEVVIKAPWGYEIDIWSVACMIWDVFEGRHLFYGKSPEHGGYRGRDHLREMIALLGPPPPEFVAQFSGQSKLFLEAGSPLPSPVSLESRESNLEGSEKQLFLQFMSKMLQWDPKKRSTASQLLDDEWLKLYTQ